MNKKMIAPIVIGVLIALYMIFWLITLFVLHAPAIILTMMGVPLIAFLGLWVYVVMERIQEIRSGEEDDLSKY